MPSRRDSVIAELSTELLSGRVDFGRFARETDGEWRALARMLLRRWDAPPSAGEDDLVQEMLVAAWTSMPRFDPSRGPSLHRFVTYNAVDKAKKWLHKARKATREGDRGRSRYPVPASMLRKDERAAVEYLDRRRVSPDASPEEAIEREQERRESLIRVLEQMDDDLDRLLVLAVVDAEGDLELAASRLWEDSRMRLALRGGDREDVRKKLRRAVARAAEADRSASRGINR